MTDLIERYVYDVTRRLPERQRQDVGRELRSEIEAMAEDEVEGRKPGKKHVYTVLIKMGDPAVLADRYLERQRYLIGPVYYGMYIELLKLLLLVIIPVAIFFTFMGRLATINEPFVGTLFHSLGFGVEVAVHVFFWSTVSIVLVERFLVAKRSGNEMWTPELLPALPDGQRISKSYAMVGITWSAIALWASLMQIPEIHRMFAPDVPLFFAPEMWPYWTLALLGISILSLGAEIMKLIVGGWTKAMVIVITLTNVLVISFFTSLIALVKPVANPEFTALVSRLLGRSDAIVGMELGIKIFVAAVVLISLYEICAAVKSYVMSKRRETK